MRLRAQSGGRRRLAGDDEDPLAGLVNLFDVAMVFGVGLVVALVHAEKVRIAAAESATRAGAITEDTDTTRIERFRESAGELVDGRGERLGTAYRLVSGEIVYVPDADSR